MVLIDRGLDLKEPKAGAEESGAAGRRRSLCHDRQESLRRKFGVGKHAAEHLTQSLRKRKQPKVRLREGREAFRGQTNAAVRPKRETSKAKPGARQSENEAKLRGLSKGRASREVQAT